MKFKKIVSLFAAATMAVSSFAGLGVTASAAAVSGVAGTVDNLVATEATTIYHLLADAESAGAVSQEASYQKGYLYYNNELASVGSSGNLYYTGKTSYDIDGTTKNNNGIRLKGNQDVFALKLSAGSTLKTYISGGGGGDRYGTLSTTLGSSGDLVTTETLGNYTTLPLEYTASADGIVYLSATGDSFISQIMVTVPGTDLKPTPGPTDVPTPEPTDEPVVSSDVMPDFAYTFSGSNSTELTDTTVATYYLDKDGKIQSEASNATVTAANVGYYNDHGLNATSGASFSFRAQAPFKIVAGTCTYGGATGQLTVKDTSGNTLYTSETLSLVNACYKNSTSEIVEFEYTGTGIVDVVFSTPNGGYFPYLAKESLEAEAEPVVLKYNSSEITGGNSNGNSAEYSFVSGVDANIASFFDSASDSTKLDADLISGFKNYITGTDDRYGSPSVTADLPAGSYKIYFLGYNHGKEVNATIASTGETVYDTSGGVQFAHQSNDASRVLKLYTLEFTLDSAVTGETITFDSTVDQWLPDLYAVVITNQETEGEIVPTPEPAVGAYSATWDFQRQNGAPDIALQNSAPYSYADKTGNYTLTVDTKTNGGKLNNTGYQDWAQCNDGTTFIIPAYKGMKLTWDCYNNSTASVVVDGANSVGEYIYTGDGNTLTISTSGFGYLRTFTVAPVTVYAATGTVTGVNAGVLTGSTITLTATSGQKFTGTINADNTFSIDAPKGTYTAAIDKTGYILVSNSINVSSASLGEVAVQKATEQTVSGTIVNAPAESFVLTFTSASGEATTLNVNANATSYTTKLLSGTYTVTSSTGTLSKISSQSFDVGNAAAVKNLYYPEEIPAASSFNVTVGSNGEYKTITDALAGIAKLGTPTATNRATITLAAGETFREQVRVNVPYVTITTDASNPAKVTWYYGIGCTYYSLGEDGWYDKDRAMTKIGKIATNPTNWGTTIQLDKDGIRLENLYIENSFNQYYTDEEFADGVEPNGVASSGQQDRTTLRAKGTAADTNTATERASALYFRTNKNEFYNCTIISSQDTIGTGGSAYFNDCTLVGNTDYICAGGNIVFDNCDLLFGGYSDIDKGGALTAYNGDGTYVFRNCTIGNYQNAAGTRRHGTHTYGRDWGGVNAHVFFLNCDVQDGTTIKGWGNMGGAVNAGTADLHVYDFSNPGAYTTAGSKDPYNITAINFATAKAKYENVIDMLGFTPDKMTTAITTKEALSNAAEDRKDDNGNYVYGVVTTIKQGSDASIDSITWTVKSGNSAYSFSTSDTVDGTNMLNKGTFPTISGEGTAEVAMLFHAQQGTYEVVSQAE